MAERVEKLVFSLKLDEDQLVTWLKPKLPNIDLNRLKDNKINGAGFLLLHYEALKDLGFNFAERIALAKVIKSIKFCYLVRATYHGAKKTKGIRASVYRYAQQHQACYSPEHLFPKSIWYDNDSDDLQIALVFENISLALIFQTFLTQLFLDNPLVTQGVISVQKKVEVVYVDADLEYVRLTDYEASEYESPIQSLEELSGVQSLQSSLSVASASSPFAQFQSMEVLDPNLRPYRCHIKPKAKFSKLEHDESNMLACSWSFHQKFDGLNTEDDVSGASDVPLIALKADPNVEPIDEMVGEPPQKRARVSLLLECRSDTVETTISALLKPGSKRISHNVWQTFVHVPNAKIFCECLDWRYKETHSIWEKLDADSQ